MKSTSIIERIEYAAQNGVFEISLYVWNKTAQKLRKEGFTLTETKIKNVRKGEGHYLISWKDSYNVPNHNLNLNDLTQSVIETTGSISVDTLLKTFSERHIEITAANRMWLIAATSKSK